jgi:hypothetical protein
LRAASGALMNFISNKEGRKMKKYEGAVGSVYGVLLFHSLFFGSFLLGNAKEMNKQTKSEKLPRSSQSDLPTIKEPK